MSKLFILTIMAMMVFTAILPHTVHAQYFGIPYSDSLEFAAGLEETLGHFWALEQNLDEGNTTLALTHAMHPIAELYDTLKPTLVSTSPDLDTKIKKTLTELSEKANTNVSRDTAQQAIDDAKEIVEKARQVVILDSLSNDPAFKAELINGLLATSVAEYSIAVNNGTISEMAEFQDGSAFVWRSQQIFDTIKTEFDPNTVRNIDGLYDGVWSAYDSRADPADVEMLVNSIILEFNTAFDLESNDDDPLIFVENIRNLLEETRQAYNNGEKDLALSLAAKAYLDHYEFLEAPLVDLGHEELMKKVEVMLRVELRDMIRSDADPGMVSAHIDDILAEMDEIAVIVPEFGTIAVMILVVAIVGIITITSKSRLGLRV
ncbi:MAG: PEFG-CTERM sorting domain-containing protein [Thaumarchaeota archaeon]|nr:PEFG-CTERM sorting domain-containing protein [Nitrososphaerota archaeon]